MLKPNDIVLCIDDRPTNPVANDVSLKSGRHYTISNITQCCTSRLSLKEIPDSGKVHHKNNSCSRCQAYNVMGYFAWRFIKIAGDDINTEDTKEKCLDLPNQKMVQKTGFINALKRLKEKVLT